MRVADSDVCQRSFTPKSRPSALSRLSLSSSLLAAVLIHYSSPNLSHLDDTADRYQPTQTKIYRTNSRREDTKWGQNLTAAFLKREINVVHGQQFYQKNEIWGEEQSFLAVTCCCFISCCSRLLSKSTEEPDFGEGGRRCVNRVQAQDVSLGCGVMAEGQWPSQRKQQVTLMLHLFPSQVFMCSSSLAKENIPIFLKCYICWCPLCLFQLKNALENLYNLLLKTLLQQIPGGALGSTNRHADSAVVNGVWLLYLQIFRGGRWLRKFKRANRVFFTSAGIKSFPRNPVVNVRLVLFWFSFSWTTEY